MQSAIYGKNQAAALPTHQPFLRAGYWQDLSADDLVEHCRQGDPEAFNALIHRYKIPVFRMAYRLAGNYDDAQEIAAEAFLRIYRAIDTLHYVASLPAWINRVVANVNFDMQRRAGRRPAVSLDALPENVCDAVYRAGNYSAISPHSHAEASERRHILHDAIALLPDYQRVTVMLYHDTGQTYDEIADTMHIPVGTVKSRLHRAHRALRKTLAPARTAFVD